VSVYVIDASVAAKWFADEEHKQAARRALSGQHELHAPDFLLIEMDNVISKWLRGGLVDATEADRIRRDLRALPLKTYRFPPLLDSAYAIARETGRSVYDSLYVALAVALDERVATGDRRLYNALAGGRFVRYVLWVEDIE